MLIHLQRNYCRITPTSKNNTFKHFTQWLKDEFHGQQAATDEDFQTALLEEEGLFGAQMSYVQALLLSSLLYTHHTITDEQLNNEHESS